MHFGLHGILYHEYLERTTPEQRTVYYEHAMLRNLKQSYWNTPPEKRPQFGQPEIGPATKQMTLDAMIEASLQKQREINLQQQAEQDIPKSRRRKAIATS